MDGYGWNTGDLRPLGAARLRTEGGSLPVETRCQEATGLADGLRVADHDRLDSRKVYPEAREGLRETDKRETRIFVQTHPDVLVIPPDPPQLIELRVRHRFSNVHGAHPHGAFEPVTGVCQPPEGDTLWSTSFGPQVPGSYS